MTVMHLMQFKPQLKTSKRSCIRHISVSQIYYQLDSYIIISEGQWDKHYLTFSYYVTFVSACDSFIWINEGQLWRICPIYTNNTNSFEQALALIN